MVDWDRSDWELYRAGDQLALERIVHRHRSHLLKYCLYVTGRRESAEDVVQETFLKLVRHRQSTVAIDSLANWLFICARNLCLNLLRCERRESAPPLPQEMAIAPAYEIQAFIERVLMQLDPEERELILMREQMGHGIAEIAKIFEISEEAVRVRLYRVRKKMQALGKR